MLDPQPDPAINAPLQGVPPEPAPTPRPQIHYTDLWSHDGKHFVAAVEDLYGALEVRKTEILMWGSRLFVWRPDSKRYCECTLWRALIGRISKQRDEEETKRERGQA